MSKISIRCDEALIQLSKFLSPEPDLLLLVVAKHTTSQKLSSSIASALEKDTTPVWLEHPLSDESRKRLIDLVSESNLLSGISDRKENMPIRAPHRQLIPPASSILAQETFRKAALEGNDKEEPFLYTLQLTSRLWCPTIEASLRIETLQQIKPHVTVITTPNVLFDTGSAHCYITEDVIPDSFLQRTNEKAVLCYVALNFSNTVIELSILLHILPAGRLPNGLSGVLLGQRTFLDGLHYEAIPREVLLKMGGQCPEGVWGDIIVKTCFDAVKNELRDIQEEIAVENK